MALGMPVIAFDLLELKGGLGSAFLRRSARRHHGFCRLKSYGSWQTMQGAVTLRSVGLARVSSLDWADISRRELAAIGGIVTAV